MSLGTLYILGPSPRAHVLEGLINYFKLDVALVTPQEDAQFGELFPLKKIPAFVDAKGFKLTELPAIAYYCKFTWI